MLKKIVLFVTVGFLLILPSVNAATLSVHIENLDSLLSTEGQGITACQIYFDVTEGTWDSESSMVTWPTADGWDFEEKGPISPYSKLSTSVPGYGNYYTNEWFQGSNFISESNKLSIVLYDEFDLEGSDLLTDGLLFTITYPEDVSLSLQLTTLQFADALNQLVTLNVSETTFGAGDNELIFSAAVPVPSAFLLLFTGLCSLAALTRRKQ